MNDETVVDPRLKPAVHYIIHYADQHGLDLGSIRLQKILLFADIEYYSNYFKPLTQDKYVKGQNGPYQKDVDIVVAELKKERSISVKKTSRYGKPFTEYHATKNPCMEAFTSEEQELLERWTQDICKEHTSQGISGVTHNAVWRMAAMQEPIPLAAQMLATPYPPTAEDWDWAQQAAAQ